MTSPDHATCDDDDSDSLLHLSTAELVQAELELQAALRVTTHPEAIEIIRGGLEHTQQALHLRNSTSPALLLLSEAAAHSRGAGRQGSRALPISTPIVGTIPTATSRLI